MVHPPRSPSPPTLQSIGESLLVLPSPVPPAPVVEPVAAPSSQSEALFPVFAATFGAYLVALDAHWNVSGPSFFELHRFFAEEYERLFGVLDRLAELRRSLGSVVDLSFETDSAPRRIDADSLVTALCSELRNIELAIEHGRPFLDDANRAIVDDVSARNRRSIWMLESFLQCPPAS